MDFKAIAIAVSKYAPLLGSVISEANPIAGLIVMAIAKAFSSSSDPTTLLSSIQSDPQAEVKLKQLELEHQDALMQNQVEDHANARQREEDIIRLTGKRDGILDFIAVLVVIGFFILCGLNYFVKLDDDHIVVMLVGQISSGFMLILGYYFGSSNK